MRYLNSKNFPLECPRDFKMICDDWIRRINYRFYSDWTICELDVSESKVNNIRIVHNKWNIVIWRVVNYLSEAQNESEQHASKRSLQLKTVILIPETDWSAPAERSLAYKSRAYSATCLTSFCLIYSLSMFWRTKTVLLTSGSCCVKATIQ